MCGHGKKAPMNESEARRRELLRQTRKLYQDSSDIPAVHPRYGRIYHNLYGNEDTELEKESSSFYLRLVISILCFICFVFMEQNKTEVAEVNSDVIVNEIEKDIDINTVAESWKSL